MVIRMIFVAVGTQKFPLNRLLKQIDDLVESGAISEPVFAQIGNSDYRPRNYEYQQFLEKEEFDKKIEECSLLITHSGVGTIISGISSHKPVIVFPRLEKYGEHVDDHQKEIAESFSEMNYILVCDENANLVDLIQEAKNHKFSVYVSQRKNMVKTVRDFLNKI